jgi:60 kDa SS-A/Ro ribonucleoprotein
MPIERRTTTNKMNKSLFSTLRSFTRPPDATNDAGAPAFQLSPEAALAQIACTGCLSQTFYATAETQLDRVLELARQVDTDFLARTALYSRQVAHMKDMPALLCAMLASRSLDRLNDVFPQVINNARLLRNFVQAIRSGVTGRKSLGSAPRRLARQWLDHANDETLLAATIGNDPSLADVIKMVHPKPRCPRREALYAWIIGKPHDPAVLPDIVQEFEAWKADRSLPLPRVPFRLLTAQPLTTEQWTEIARHANWTTTRMNLNTFSRHGVLKNTEMVNILAQRLSDAALVRQAKVFPYQLLAAFLNVTNDIPQVLSLALQDALEVATEQVPALQGNVFVAIDISGSMQSPVTGEQQGRSSKVRCLDVAALIGAAIMRKNPLATIIPFHEVATQTSLTPRDSVMTNARMLASLPSGGTDCSAPLRWINLMNASPSLVIIVSDNESWCHANNHQTTPVMKEWSKIKARQPDAKLVCIDLAPNTTTQAPDRADILNIGGFSDEVFTLVKNFADSSTDPDHWLQRINQQQLRATLRIA